MIDSLLNLADKAANFKSHSPLQTCFSAVPAKSDDRCWAI